MTPSITTHANGATIEADEPFVRMLLVEAKRSGQAQIGAFGVSPAFRSHWAGLLAQIDGLLVQLPGEGLSSQALRQIDPIDPGFVAAVSQVEPEGFDLLDDMHADEEIDLLADFP